MKNLLLLLFLPSIFFAQSDWEYVGESSSKDLFYFKDVEKKSYSDKITFWVKIQKPVTIVKTKKGSIKKAGNYIISKWEADCKEETIETKIYAVYNTNGSVKETSTGPFSPEPVLPDSIGESVFLTACNRLEE